MRLLAVCIVAVEVIFLGAFYGIFLFIAQDLNPMHWGMPVRVLVVAFFLWAQIIAIPLSIGLAVYYEKD